MLRVNFARDDVIVDAARAALPWRLLLLDLVHLDQGRQLSAAAASALRSRRPVDLSRDRHDGRRGGQQVVRVVGRGLRVVDGGRGQLHAAGRGRAVALVVVLVVVVAAVATGYGVMVARLMVVVLDDRRRVALREKERIESRDQSPADDVMSRTGDSGNDLQTHKTNHSLAH